MCTLNIIFSTRIYRYRVVCDLVNDSTHLSEKRLIGNGGNVSVLNVLLSSYGFSRDLNRDLRYNSFSLGWRSRGVMLFHPTLVVTPEVESSKLWWLNICGTSTLFFFFHQITTRQINNNNRYGYRQLRQCGYTSTSSNST